jgi:hypothetical protein
MAFTMEFGTGFEMGQIPVRAGWFLLLAPAPTAAAAHTGTYGLVLRGDHGGYFTVIREVPAASLDLSLWGIPCYNEQPNCCVYTKIGATNAVNFRYNLVSKCWDVYLGDVLLASGAVATTETAYQHLQARILLDEAGYVQTMVDGIPDIVYSGDTRVGTNLIDRLHLAAPGGGFFASCAFDDLAIGTGGWPGDIRFDPIYVTGDVEGECDWSPSAGSDHYALVDERPPSSTDYVYARSDLGERLETPGTWDDTDGLGNIVKDPLAVIVWADVRKQDGNQDDKLSLVQSDGTNEVAQAAESLLTSYENRWYIRELAPDGGGWTTAKVNTLVIGLEADVEEVE